MITLHFTKRHSELKEGEQCKRDGTLAKKQEREKHLAVKEAEAILRQASSS